MQITNLYNKEGSLEDARPKSIEHRLGRGQQLHEDRRVQVGGGEGEEEGRPAVARQQRRQLVPHADARRVRRRHVHRRRQMKHLVRIWKV